MTSTGTRRCDALLIVVLVVVVLLPRPTIAEEVAAADRARARQLFEEGVAANAASEYERAEERFQKSYDLVPSYRALSNLAKAQESSRRLPEAYRSYRRLERDHAEDLDQSQRDQLERIIEALEGQVAIVEISCQPGATIIVDGSERGAIHDAEPRHVEVVLEPGAHIFGARGQGFETAVVERTVGLGERATVVIALNAPAEPEAEPEEAIVEDEAAEEPLATEEAPVVPVAPAPPPEPAVSERRQRRPFWRTPWFWVVTSVVVAAGIGGSVTGVALTRDDRDQEQDLDVDWTLRMP